MRIYHLSLKVLSWAPHIVCWHKNDPVSYCSPTLPQTFWLRISFEFIIGFLGQNWKVPEATTINGELVGDCQKNSTPEIYWMTNSAVNWKQLNSPSPSPCLPNLYLKCPSLFKSCWTSTNNLWCPGPSQLLDSAMHWINHSLEDSVKESYVMHWIAIYPVDSYYLLR